MVTCSQCTTPNSPGRDACEKCGADLLPLPPVSRKVWSILRAALLGLLLIALGLLPLILWHHLAVISTWKDLSLLLVLAGLVVFLRELARALRPVPLYARYLHRAARHAQSDPSQAMEDFVHAVMLAPAAIREGLSLRLPRPLKTLVSHTELNLSAATSGYQSPEGVRKIIYSGYTLWARLAEGIPALQPTGKAVQPRLQRKKIAAELGRIFNDLAADGLVKKLGYCPKCRQVVLCDGAGHCSCGKKHGIPRGIVFVPPEEADLFSRRLLQVYAA